MSEHELSRRQFGRRAAEATALLGAGLVPGGDSSAAQEHPPAVAEPIPPASIPVELLLLEVVRRLHPDRRLEAGYLQDVRRDIAAELRRARTIRDVPLGNAHEPAPLFAAYRSDPPSPIGAPESPER